MCFLDNLLSNICKWSQGAVGRRVTTIWLMVSIPQQLDLESENLIVLFRLKTSFVLFLNEESYAAYLISVTIPV